jgi:hypothetical protein
MTARKKTHVPVEFFIERKQWVATGPKLRVEAPTLQAARRRIRKAAEEAYGAGVELDSTLRLPSTIMERIERYKEQKAQHDAAARALRVDLVSLVDFLRHNLGASYEDAATFIGIDAAALLRAVHSTQTVEIDSGED